MFEKPAAEPTTSLERVNMRFLDLIDDADKRANDLARTFLEGLVELGVRGLELAERDASRKKNDRSDGA